MSVETHPLTVVSSLPQAVAERTLPCAAPTSRTADLSPLLLGPSRAIATLWEQMRHLAPHFRMLLMTGEPGTRAEAAARVLHELSPAASGDFQVLSAEEMERLFASFSLETDRLPALGTLFLPEVEKLSRAAQAGLLRFLYTRASRNLRVIAFAGRGLRAQVGVGAFSPELAAALGAVRLALPSLHQRREDIPMLVEFFLERLTATSGGDLPRLEPGFLAAASRLNWPGNLDQLEAVLGRLVSTPDAVFTPGSLADALAAEGNDLATQQSTNRLVKLDQVVAQHIHTVLVACNGNKLRAAQVLGISRSTLYRMLETPSYSSSIGLAS